MLHKAMSLPPLFWPFSVTPPDKAEAIREVENERAVSVDRSRMRSLDQEEARLAQSIRWLWYEFTPYEVGCDEIGGESTLSWSFSFQT